MVECRAFPQGLVYRHCDALADGQLLLLQKGLSGGRQQNGPIDFGGSEHI